MTTPEPSALRESILESITDAFVALDGEFRYIWVNAEAERLGGKPRSEMIGRVIWAVFPELIGTVAETKCREALSTRAAIEFENYMPSWDRWFFNKVYPTKDGGLVFFWREITDRKHAEAALRRQGAILEQVHDSIIATDLAGNITLWNHGARKIFGYSPEEVIGRHVSMLYFAEDRLDVYERVLPPLLRDGQLSAELRNQRKDGAECFIRLSRSLLRDDFGEPYGMLGVAMDVTEQRHAEAKLRKSEEFHRLLIDALPQIIYSTNAAGQTDMIGGRWQEYSGVSADEAFGLNWLEWIHPADMENVISRWGGSLVTGERFETVYRVRNRAGEYRWHLSLAVPVRDAKGEIVQWVGSLSDIHDRVTFEESLRVSEESMRLAQEAAGIRHFNCVIRKSGRAARTEDLEFLVKQFGAVQAEDTARVRAELEEGLARAWQDISIGYRSVETSGATAWRLCQAKVFETPNGDDAQVIGVIVDVTAQKRAEEAARIDRERKRLENVIANLAEAVIILGSDGSILSANPAALRMHGFEAEDQVPESLRAYAELFELTRANGNVAPREEWPGYRALRGETVVAEELHVRNRKTGATLAVSTNASPVRDEQGEILMAVVSIWDMTAERAISDEVNRANESLQGMSAQLLRLQDEERKRIAREIHDGTLQLITAMSMNLLLISKAPAVAGEKETQRLITETQELGKRSARELRSLAYILHPPDLDELGLAVALRSWADGFAQRTGLALDVQLRDPGRLEANIETALFRIAQESLANVHKHSGSARAELRLMVSEEAITLEIEDHGRGILPGILKATPRGVGVGILGMRERVRQLGGALQISSEGGGTKVRAILPRGGER